MNHIFSPYLDWFLDVYLDDIMVYSDTLEDHIQHCKTAINVLSQEKLYLSKKIYFLPEKLKLLGQVLQSKRLGIQTGNPICYK